MKQQAVAIRVGWVIEYKGKPWTVVKATHIKPGKGGAFMQVEMKSVEEGTKTNERFRSEDTVEQLMVEEKDCQFLYEDSLGLTFMNSETF
jgi:elongation factor P